MVNQIRKALAGFILLPGGPRPQAPEKPYRPESVIFRACSLRGFSDKDKQTMFLALPGHGESDVLRRLRGVVVENDAPPSRVPLGDGLNLVIFRGVFGSGGFGVDVRSVTLRGTTLEVECDFEDPGDGIRTTAGFTQPAAIVPLEPLPEGKYRARLMVRRLCRSSQGVREQAPSRECANISFKVSA